ncbi:MAG: FG-GAP repeat domain-containing protein [Saprospiraceae bacterium]
MRNTLITIIILSLINLIACNKETTQIPTITPEPMDSVKVASPNILATLTTNYEQLPEQEIAISLDSSIYAQYAMPTDRYRHGILGDRVEGGQLVVAVEGVFYELTLEDTYVFEDIRPRLYDVDGDGELEFITLRTHTGLGGGIAIYKIVNEQLVEYAQVTEIGRSNRWLNVVAINDLDNDGIVELAWIETPHIGGTLKVAKIENGTLQVIAETAQYSNHAIGERNLCLSILTEQSGQKVIYVPNQSKNKIVGFIFENGQWQLFEEIDQVVDFSKPLITQYAFDGVVEEEDNCI